MEPKGFFVIVSHGKHSLKSERTDLQDSRRGVWRRVWGISGGSPGLAWPGRAEEIDPTSERTPGNVETITAPLQIITFTKPSLKQAQDGQVSNMSSIHTVKTAVRNSLLILQCVLEGEQLQ